MQRCKNIADRPYQYGGAVPQKWLSRIRTFRPILSIFSNTPPYKLPEGLELSKNVTGKHCSPSRLKQHGMVFVYKFLKLRSGGGKNRFWTEISANLEPFLDFFQIVPYEGPKSLKLSKNVTEIICRGCRGHSGWPVFILKYLIISSLEGAKFPCSTNFGAL
jgi:hypothetical protein